jgi:hypothetical protein
MRFFFLQIPKVLIANDNQFQSFFIIIWNSIIMYVCEVELIFLSKIK